VRAVLAIVLLLSGVLLGSGIRDAAEPRIGAGRAGLAPPSALVRFAEGEVVAHWRTEASAAALEIIHGAIVEEEADGPVTVIRVPAGEEVNAARRLASHPDVLWAQPNYLRRVQMSSNDPLFGQQWGLQKIQGPQASDINTGSAAIVVAVIDTGVDLKHPDLQGKIIAGRNVLRPDDPPQDDGGHGTHVAGTIAATLNNSIGIAGVAPGVSIMPIKVLRSSGAGRDSSVATGIRWATDNGARVINMSFTGTDASSALTEAVAYAASRNVVLVAAAGNERSSTPNYPAATESAIAVAATDTSDRRAFFTNYGNWIDVSAPGTRIVSTYWDRGSSYQSDSGTSMAAAHVSGVAALLLSVRPGLTTAEVEGILKATADPTGDAELGAGRINAARALAAALQGPLPSPGPTSTTLVPVRTPTPVPIPPPTSLRTEAPEAVEDRAPQAGETIYLPVIPTDGERWTSEITIQSISGEDGTGNLELIDSDGVAYDRTEFNLEGQAATTIAAFGEREAGEYPAGIIRASVSVTVVARITSVGREAMTYEGQVSGSEAVYGPVALRERNAGNTVAFVQNLGVEPAEVEVTYAQREPLAGSWVEIAMIPPHANLRFPDPLRQPLPEDFLGSLAVRSTTGQPLALVSFEFQVPSSESGAELRAPSQTPTSAPEAELRARNAKPETRNSKLVRR
jgi:thermitase